MPKTKKRSKVSITDGLPLQEFQGFKVLPITMDGDCRHYIYMKKHETRTPSTVLLPDCTLFLLNLPVDTTDDHLQHLFHKYGRVKSIFYHDSPTSVNVDEPTTTEAPGKKKKKRKDQKKEEVANVPQLRRLLCSGAAAHVVFVTPQDLTRVLEMTQQERKWDTGKELQPLGLQRYMLRYQISRPDPARLQSEVDEFMLKFKTSEYEKEREKLERLSKMDEDGFVVVTRHKKGRATDGTIAVSVASNAIDPTKLKKKELVDFYRFQMRERKKNELAELRRRFEEDKARIAKQRENRRFKPF